ncbi:HAMP domain-containing sensor histidine kinase, partial [Rhizobium sp. Pop5]
ASNAKSEFLSRMSHELRTPLNSVLGFAQLLEMDVDDPESRESVAQILRAGRHLLSLIDEVLDMARIEAGRMDLAVEAQPVAEVIEEAVALAKPLCGKQQIRIEVIEAEPDLMVLADRRRLLQVLLNLLSNAVKYNRPQGSVTVSYRALDDRIRIEVSDTGPGIPAERVARLFTPFDRLGAERISQEGTGLGLALSKHLIDAMGGTLGFSNRKGGATFHVDLPRAPVAIEERGLAIESSP